MSRGDAEVRRVFSWAPALWLTAAACLLNAAVPVLPGWAQWPLGHASRAVWLAVAACWAAAATAVWLAGRRGPAWRARRDLDAAAARLAVTSAGWLNRGEHLVFAVNVFGARWWRIAVIDRIEEDKRREVDEAGGAEVAVTYDRYLRFPATRTVIRTDRVVLVTAAGDTRPLPAPLLGGAWRASRMPYIPGLGTGPAAPAEITELLRQLAAAEPVDMEGGRG